MHIATIIDKTPTIEMIIMVGFILIVAAINFTFWNAILTTIETMISIVGVILVVVATVVYFWKAFSTIIEIIISLAIDISIMVATPHQKVQKWENQAK